MRKLLLIITIVLMSLLIAGCTSAPRVETMIISTDIHVYRSIENLIDDSSAIMRVELLDQRVEYKDISVPFTQEMIDTFFGGVDPGHEPLYVVMTLFRARVIEVYKGDREVGDIIEIAQSGGELEKEDGTLRRVLYSDRTPLEVGDDMVAFLFAWHSISGTAGRDIYSLMSPNQAAFRFPVAEGGIAAFGFDKELESIHERNSLTLTLWDLTQIADNNFSPVQSSPPYLEDEEEYSELEESEEDNFDPVNEPDEDMYDDENGDSEDDE